MDGPPPAEADFTSLSVEERLSHKVWKARVSAYEELIKTFRTTVSESDPAFNPYINNATLLQKAITDSNAVAQEKGLECACSFVEWSGKNAAKIRDALIPSVAEKGLGSTRAGTKKFAAELALLYVEVDGNSDGVVPSLLDALSSKQPKVVAGNVAAIKEIVKQFGPKIVNVKPILKQIPTIFAHADKGVRAEGTSLVQELHRYLGPALEPHLADLKPVQVKELTEGFAGLDKGQQTRFTRQQQKEKAIQETEGTLEGKEADADGEAEQEDEAAPSAYDFAEPVNVLNNLPTDFYTKLASSKWKERKEEALDPLLALLKVPKLADGSYDELVRALAGRMTDANIMCVIVAANCIEQLAKGLRAAFSKYKGNVVPPMLERFKEKKANVIEALANSLDAVFETVAISDTVEDVVPAISHKNPSVKAEALHWLVRCLQNTRQPPTPADVKALTAALLVALGDSFEPVRAASADALGTLMKLVGERAFAAHMENLDDIKRAKVKECFDKATVKCKTGSAAPPAKAAPALTAKAPSAAPKKPVAKAPPKAAPSFDKENITPPASPQPARTAPPKSAAKPAVSRAPPRTGPPPTAAPAKKPVAAATKAPPKAATAPSEPIKYRISQEDAEAKFESVFPTEVLADLGNGNWKLRLAAMEALQSWCEGEGAGTEAELVVRLCRSKPGWKESNFQVYGKMAALFQYLAENSATWTRACAALTISPLSDKLGDIKLKKPCGDALVGFSEKFSLQFVLEQAYDPMTKQKAPKAQADSILWIDSALRDFGTTGVSPRDLIEFLKNGLKSSNAGVRTNATKALVTLKLYVGADIMTFIQDLNPQLLTTIESEFAKVDGESPPAPTRTSADNAALASGPAKGGKGKAADAMEDLFPRVDLDKLVSSAVIKASDDANWKNRKEALETIQGILEANKRLKPNLGDIAGALKARLSDSNKVVQGLALDIVARIASGMNKPFERYARNLIGPTCAVLADQKAHVRAAAVTTLTAIAEACTLEPLISTLATSLEVQNPAQRKELLTWLGDSLKEASPLPDLSPLAVPILSCLEDRSADVRKAAQSILPSIIASAGYDYVVNQVSSLKPASRSTVMPMIDAAKSSAPTQSTQPSASSSRPGTSLGLNASTSGPLPAASAAGPSAALAKKIGAPRLGIQKQLAGPMPSSPRAATPSSPVPGRLTSRKPTPTSPRASGAATPARASVASTSGAAEVPLKSSDLRGKQMRASKEVGSLKWVVEGNARPDQVEYLHQQMGPQVSAELLALLFSRDHYAERDHMAGLSILVDSSSPSTYPADKYDLPWEQMSARFVANTDIILKYITIRFCDTGTSMALKCLDLVENMFRISLDAANSLSDYEASAFLPSLINKAGDPKETIRVKVRALIKTFSDIYPISKICSNLLDHGVHSKNARVRTESADEIASLFQRHGMSTCQPAKAMPVIASLVSDRDSAVRNAALMAIANAYAVVGDGIWKHIGQVTDKDRTMIEEKLKRTTAPSSPRAVSASSSTMASRAATPSRPTSSIGNSRPESRAGGMKPPSTGLRRPSVGLGLLGAGASKLPSIGHGIPSVSAATPRKPTSKKPLSASTRSSTEQDLMNLTFSDPLVQQISSNDPNESVEALKEIQRLVNNDTSSLVPQANDIIKAIAAQAHKSFDGLSSGSADSTLRLCKHILQTLSGFFDQEDLSNKVKRDALVVLLAELAKRLLETAEEVENKQISSLSKVLNMVLIRIFHHTDKTACFGALITILRDATVDLRELRGPALEDRSKYAELIMKCLWKISKTVKESLEDRTLDPKQLLLDVDQFLSVTPPAEWRRRATDEIPLGDMPLRTLKTILQQVVVTFGESAYDELVLIDHAENSFVYQYLFRLLNNARVGSEYGSETASTARSSPLLDNQATPRQVRTASAQSPRLSDAPATNGSPSSRSDIEMNNRLKEIFDKIGNAQESKKGIAELYEFQKQYPQAEARVNQWITATGSFFQSYLRRALGNLAAEESERAAVTASPSTPKASATNGVALSPIPRPHSTFIPPPSPKIRSSSGSTIQNDQKLNDLKALFAKPV